MAEKTNIFSMLNLSNNEIIHSRFIKSILEFNDEIKKNFIKLLNTKLPDDNQIPLDRIFKIRNEHVLKNNLGRADIYFTNGQTGDTRIIIENKIYANDQENQLVNYYQHLNLGKYKYSYLFYLTLEGRNASLYSTNKKDLNELKYYKLSYYSDIIPLIENISLQQLTNKQFIYLSDYLEILKEMTKIGEMANERFEVSKGITENKYYSYLELLFWQLLEERIIKELDKFPLFQRKYNHTKISKCHSNRKDKNLRNYGLIFEDTRIHLDIKAKELHINKGKFENNIWNENSDYDNISDLPNITKLLNKKAMEEAVQNVFEKFVIFFNLKK